MSDVRAAVLARLAEIQEVMEPQAPFDVPSALLARFTETLTADIERHAPAALFDWCAGCHHDADGAPMYPAANCPFIRRWATALGVDAGRPRTLDSLAAGAELRVDPSIGSPPSAGAATPHAEGEPGECVYCAAAKQQLRSAGGTSEAVETAGCTRHVSPEGARWLINHCGNAPNVVAADREEAQAVVDQCRANGHGCFVQPLPSASPEAPAPGEGVAGSG